MVAAAAGESRFASVRVIGAEVLPTGTEPKSYVEGVRMRPCTGTAEPVRESVYGFPVAEAESVRTALEGPRVWGRNCTASQQLGQLAVVAANAEAGRVPCVPSMSGARATLKADEVTEA